MIGFIILTHNQIGTEMLRSIEEFLDPKSPMVAIPVTHQDSKDTINEAIEGALQQMDSCHGIVLLVDLPGASPANFGKTFAQKENVAALYGVNLPILIKAANMIFEKSAQETARFLKDYGKESISISV